MDALPPPIPLTDEDMQAANEALFAEVAAKHRELVFARVVIARLQGELGPLREMRAMIEHRAAMIAEPPVPPATPMKVPKRNRLAGRTG